MIKSRAQYCSLNNWGDKKVGLKCPSVRPSTKSVFDFNDIWYAGRGRWVTHDGIAVAYDPIQGQDHEPLNVGHSAIFKGYLLPIYNEGWQMTTFS